MKPLLLTKLVSIHLVLLLSWSSSLCGQTPHPSMPVPPLVVRDDNGELVGQVISARFSRPDPAAQPEGWIPVALLKHGDCNIPVEVRPEWLHTGVKTFFSSFDCTGPAMVQLGDFPNLNWHWHTADCGFFMFNKDWEIYEINFPVPRFNVYPNSGLTPDGFCFAFFTTVGLAVYDGVYDGQMSLKTPFKVE